MRFDAARFAENRFGRAAMRDGFFESRVVEGKRQSRQLVQVRPHKLFGRKGDHLTITVPVTFAEAALGAEISIPTLDDGPVRLKLPAGTPNGRTFRVHGRGVKGGAATGDLLVSVEVQVPKHLNEEAKTALLAYATQAGEPDPRAELIGGAR